MRELYLESGKTIKINDDYSNSINHGSRAYIYPYEDGCLKLFLDSIRGLTNFDDDGRVLVPINEKKVEVLKRINDLNYPNIYKISDFFKCEYEYASLNNGERIIRYGGYISNYIEHFHNDLTHNGKPCFNILTLDTNQLIKYFDQMLELIMYLTEHHFEVNDLHRRNVVKGKDHFTLIDCDEYKFIPGRISLEHNISELRKCFADLITAGLYFTFEVGSDQEYNSNNMYILYNDYVKNNLINYDHVDLRNIYDFINILKRYNKPYEYFEEQYKLIKRK